MMNRLFSLIVSAAALALSPMTAIGGEAEAQAQTGCDQKALTKARAEFQRLKDSRRRGDQANDEEFRAASEELILLSEDCYLSKYGSLEEGQKIDDGGLWARGGSIQPRHNLQGTKWGAGTLFATPGDNFDATGPRLAGGEISYSFMANGVSIGNDGSSGASCAPTCLNTSLFSFVFTDSGGDTIFAQCLLDEIDAAFAAWSAVADITFVNVTDNGAAFDAAGASGDIRIGFHPFDGASGVLAHAFFPPPNLTSAAGDLHFDVDESWGCSPAIGLIDIGIVALHEIGHSIGLRHEPTDLAVMNPSYNPALTFGPLADDIIGAGEIYGEAGAATTAFFGDVGIGTDDPGASLEVLRDDGSARILVKEDSGTIAQRPLFELSNNGGPGFRLTNSNTATTWFFSMNSLDQFQFSLLGTGGAEFLIQKDGRVLMGPGPGFVFNLSPLGDLTIAGDLTADGILYPSDRSLKQDVAAVAPGEVLRQVVELPVATWAFKDRSGVRHIGPMAQDFYRLFGFGPDERHINPMDAAGVALAAIQGLDLENARLRGQLSEQQEEIDSLKRELAELRALVGSATRR